MILSKPPGFPKYRTTTVEQVNPIQTAFEPTFVEKIPNKNTPVIGPPNNPKILLKKDIYHFDLV